MIDPAGGNGRTGWGERLAEFLRSQNTGEMFYGWRLVLIGILILLVGREISNGLIGTAWSPAGFPGDGIGPPWNVLVVAGGVIGWLVSLWIAGRGVDRFGPKRMVLIGLPLVGVVALCADVPPGVGFYPAMAGAAALATIAAYLPAITALNNWFRNRLALALALTLFGSSIGATAIRYLFAALLVVMDGRLMTLAAGVVIVIVALPLARATRDRPDGSVEHPDGLARVAERSHPDYPWREAMRARQFWMLTAAGACASVSYTVASFYDWQIIAQSSATFEAIDKFATFEKFAPTAGILLGGLACYRCSVKFVLSIAAVVQTAAILALLSGFGPALLPAVVLLGLASGVGTAPAIAAVGIYFGRRRFGVITVTGMLFEYAATYAALPAAGYTIFFTETYAPIFVAGAVVSLIGAGLYLKLGEPRLSPSQKVENPAIS